MKHPYTHAPNRAFWSRSVASGLTVEELNLTRAILPTDRVVSAGSCFASNLVPYLERSGIHYVKTETRHPLFRWLPEDSFGYDRFSAAYGNIYTARQFLQLLQRALGMYQPTEDRWHIADNVVDPFRPGLRWAARSDQEFDALTAQHLSRVCQAIKSGTVLVFTLGLTEAWISAEDGAVFPACPGTISGVYDAEKHKFHNFSVTEVCEDLQGIVQVISEINPPMRIVLSVSPVPLVATATNNHVLVASTYSKSVLRVAAEECAASHKHVTYFPSYELLTGPQAASEFFAPDKRNVTEAAVDYVMGILLGEVRIESHSKNEKTDASASLSAAVLAECEELMAERE